jgi:hypothetical protein
MPLLEGKQKTPDESGVFCSADRLSWRAAASASAELAIPTTTFAGRSCSRPGTHLQD